MRTTLSTLSFHPSVHTAINRRYDTWPPAGEDVTVLPPGTEVYDVFQAGEDFLVRAKEKINPEGKAIQYGFAWAKEKDLSVKTKDVFGNVVIPKPTNATNFSPTGCTHLNPPTINLISSRWPSDDKSDDDRYYRGYVKPRNEKNVKLIFRIQ